MGIKNPIENINPFYYYTLLWFIPTFIKGFRKPLTKDDLFLMIDDQKSSNLGDRLEKEWEIELTKPKPSLIKALIRVFWKKHLVMTSIAVIAEIILKGVQTISFTVLLRYFSKDNVRITANEAYIQAVIMNISTLLFVISFHSYAWGNRNLYMDMRAACCSLIYRKSLKIGKSAMGKVSVGYLVNLITHDATRLDNLSYFSQSFLIAPLQIVVVGLLLYFETGWTGIFGVFIFVGLIPLQFLITKWMSKVRTELVQFAGERIKMMTEILSGIQIIKMYTWEKYFIKSISDIRRNEIKKVRYLLLGYGVFSSIISVLPKVGIFLSLLLYYLLGHTLTYIHVFTIFVYYNMLRLNVNVFVPNGLFRVAEVKASFKRIQNFLQLEEIRKHHHKKSGDNRIFIEFKNVSSVWDLNSTENTLQDLNLLIPNPRFIAIIGQVGGGKSSFLNTILNELFIKSGETFVSGTVSYSSQEAWIFPGTLKENILFGHDFNEERYKTVIKVCALERDISLLPNGDNTLIIENGENLSGGQKVRINLARAVYLQSDIYLLDDPLSAVDPHVAEIIFKECLCKFLSDKIVVLVTNQLQFLKYVDYIYFFENGRISFEGTYKKVQKDNLDFLRLLQRSDDEENIDSKEIYHGECHLGKNTMEIEEKEFLTTGAVSFKVYKNYFKLSKSLSFFALSLLSTLTFLICFGAFDMIITFWSNIDFKIYSMNLSLTREDLFTIFSIAVVVVIVAAIIGHVTSLNILINSSKNLHELVLKKVINAPMIFFHTTPSGRILNRFSKDLSTTDEFLPIIFVDGIINLFIVFVIIIIIGYYCYWFAFIFIIGIIGTQFLMRFTFPTCLAVKRLEAITKSPLYTHVKTSFNGLSLIRVFNKEEYYKNIFDFTQDFHTSSWFMHISSGHAFGILIDFIMVIVLWFISFTLFFINDLRDAAAGLVIVQCLALVTIVQWCVRLTNDQMVNMTSVERMMEYSSLDVDGEDNQDNRDLIPEKSWPIHGKIEFINVNLKYNINSKVVLKDLNFVIESKSKIGIVGRTGAGKSSICASLFQLAYTDGFIRIDGVDIKRIPLYNLRKKISIIPQDPILFSDTMRNNLDPFNEFTDAELWNVLEEVELKEVVKEFPDGLLTKIIEGGSKLSVGQRQLVCLARALIRKNKILIMDEATANVDPKTDNLIQKTIKRKFEECTILIIAHRLQTIIDCDFVLVMSGGEMIEFDYPYILLKKKGMFYDMVQKMGGGIAENLYQIAEEVFKSKLGMK
ncbi:ATP-binding cassette sub-family C member 4-like isoform X1 [Onthophagus taurus]|uniref:ATP-binding cassette sub-family C member 4-like isoform X1 n=2 Tax=Onthophagus taurus TaxID=166361 RepID=UPI0039BE9FAD